MRFVVFVDLLNLPCAWKETKMAITDDPGVY